MSLRRRIEALRRLAESTTFPAEAASARAKADALEQELEPAEDLPSDWQPGRFPSWEQAMGSNWRNEVMERHALREAEQALGAVLWEPGKWVIPGRGPAIGKDELLEMYARRAA